mmetsp:Transcript_46718/g.77602  ORF Transcript_46718/g.77602 Transcript_46718/m.77602 type:complete len:765 (+) Transcript_46718:28-2322(+)
MVIALGEVLRGLYSKNQRRAPAAASFRSLAVVACCLATAAMMAIAMNRGQILASRIDLRRAAGSAAKFGKIGAFHRNSKYAASAVRNKNCANCLLGRYPIHSLFSSARIPRLRRETTTVNAASPHSFSSSPSSANSKDSAAKAQGDRSVAGHKSWKDLNIVNSYQKELKADPEASNTRRQVDAAFSYVMPTPVKDPRLVLYSEDMLSTLGFDPSFAQTEEFVRVLGGNDVIDDSAPWAMCYGGHQFGNWAGQLGDGRAIALAEVQTTTRGESDEVDDHNNHFELQLKGAGETPYSRRADGRAVLRSSIREFLCSEFMHAVGVPTTRALSLVETGDSVYRDMFYDGRIKAEKGAIVCRVAPSFIRFGSFQLPFSRGDVEGVRALADYCISHDFKGLIQPNDPNRYMGWMREVVKRTAELIAQWQSIGFVHGVMNTDNMSPLGLTIDYGPFGFLETLRPDYTPNLNDNSLRYAYGNQPFIGKWNLYALGVAIDPLANPDDCIGEDGEVELSAQMEELIGEYDKIFEEKYIELMSAKLGLDNIPDEPYNGEGGGGRAGSFITSVMSFLRDSKADFTLFFRNLVFLDPSFEYTSIESLPAQFRRVLIQEDGDEGDDNEGQADERTARKETEASFLQWLSTYQKAIRKEASDLEDSDDYSSWRRRILANNPRIILRNYAAQLAIADAERGDYGTLKRLHQALKSPYAMNPCEAALMNRGVASADSEWKEKEQQLSELEDEQQFSKDSSSLFEEPAPQWASRSAGIAQLS